MNLEKMKIRNPTLYDKIMVRRVARMGRKFLDQALKHIERRASGTSDGDSDAPPDVPEEIYMFMIEKLKLFPELLPMALAYERSYAIHHLFKAAEQ